MRAEPAWVPGEQPPPLPPLPPLPPTPPTPPTPPSSGLPMDAELAATRDAAARIAPAAGPQEAGVTASPDGRTIRVVSPTGQVTVLDRSLFRPDQIEDLVEQAMQPAAPPPTFEDRGPPQNAIIMTAIIMFFVAITLIGLPLARAAARRMDRRAAGPQVPDDLLPRLERIEQAVDGVALEMERVSEAQRFSARLLSERLPEVLPRLDAAAEVQRRSLQGGGA